MPFRDESRWTWNNNKGATPVERLRSLLYLLLFIWRNRMQSKEDIINQEDIKNAFNEDVNHKSKAEPDFPQETATPFYSDNLRSIFDEVENMRAKMEMQEERIQQQEALMTAQNERLIELKSIIDEQDRIMRAQHNEIERQKEKVINLREENTILKLMATKGDDISDDENSKSIPKYKKPQLKINENKNFESKPYSISQGFSDTVLYDWSCRAVQRREESLKMLAYQGNVEQIRIILDNHNTNIDGRGMPDSLCSIFRGFGDKTPLILAAQQGHFETVKLLLRSGANIFIEDRNGLSAMDYAVKNKHERICNLLKLHGARQNKEYQEMSPTMSPRFEKEIEFITPSPI